MMVTPRMYSVLILAISAMLLVSNPTNTLAAEKLDFERQEFDRTPGGLPPLDEEQRKTVEDLLSEMTLSEKIGQMTLLTRDWDKQ